jgi:3-oxosteroid 1-dehydrogenase
MPGQDTDVVVVGTGAAGLTAALSAAMRGNVAAGPFGPGYPGAGATLAAGMTFGYLIGRVA